jgi:lipoprotein-releasing system permease protein
MKTLRFEWRLALRHLAHDRGQTGLTVLAVAIAVLAIIFIRSITDGVVIRFYDDLVGSLPDVTLRAADRQPAALAAGPAEGTAPLSVRAQLLATRVQKRPPQRQDIEGWAEVVEQVRRLPGVRTAVPVAQGGATFVRGALRLNVSVTGGEPAVLDGVIGLQKKLVAGRWYGLAADEVVIGWRLADEAGVRLGDRIRLEAAGGAQDRAVSSGTYRVAGIFSTGTDAADLGQAYVTLRAGQSLLGLSPNVSRILIKLNDAFQADTFARHLADALPYRTESWLQTNASELQGIQGIFGTRDLVSVFALMASAFAIASVLVVSVTQKQKQIGILKSMGARDGQILRVFTLEAVVIGVTGSTLGALSALVLLLALAKVPAPPGLNPYPRYTTLFYLQLDGRVFTGTCAAATFVTMLSATAPARRAARLDPVAAIRG